MATKEEWKKRLDEWNAAPGYNGSDLERVIVLTPVEAAVLSQLDGQMTKLDIWDKSVEADIDTVMSVLAEKYNFQQELQERRVVRWVLDGKVAIFKKGWLTELPERGGEFVKSEENKI